MMSKTRWALAAAIAVALVGAKFVLGHAASAPAPAAAAPEVTTAQVMVRPLRSSADFTGRLQAVDTVQVRPRVGGYVESVHFKEGALVKKDQLLFQIDPRPYKAEVDRLAAGLAQARAELALAETNAARGRRLLDLRAISREEADRLQTAAESARAQVASTAASLQAARLNLDFTQVRAPIDGRVSNAQVTPGNLVSSADVLTSVVSVDPVYVYFDVDEQNYLKLLAGGAAPAKGGSLDAAVAMGLADEDGYPHRGRLDFVDNQLRAGSGTIRLRAVFDNQDGRYTPGMFARLQLQSGAVRPTVLIDDRAVGTDLGNQFVYAVGKDGTAEYRKVTTGPLFHGLRTVTAGLAAGDVIVVNGLQRVRPGVQVAAQKVAMDARLDDRDRALVRGTGTDDADTRVAARGRSRGGDRDNG